MGIFRIQPKNLYICFKYSVMIKRIIEDKIHSRLFQGKAIVIYGARQVGKTTLVKQITSGYEDVSWFNADELQTRELFETQNLSVFKSVVKNKGIVVIDEAQRIKNIGLSAKLIIDNFPETQLILTGSSVLQLADKIQEPLTGRKFEFTLYPLSFEEMALHHGTFEEHKNLENRLLYGYYPEIVTHLPDAKRRLKELAGSYLYKDILTLNKIKKPDKLNRLLQSLAYQIGDLVKYNEVGQNVGLDKETVENYIDLLEKTFVIYRLGSFGKNPRNEIRKARKIYFTDLGIRNAAVLNFSPVHSRINEIGKLWENFIITERLKFLANHEIYAHVYFWRNYNKQEVDYIEERDGKIFAYEIKWNMHKRRKIPASFRKEFPDAENAIITPENYIEFITKF